MKVYSQGTQDGILKLIFDHIVAKNMFFVEFGFGYEGRKITDEVMDGVGLNTRLLSKLGWHGVYFDAQISEPKFNITKAVLTETNIGSHFKAQGIPIDVDYVSIDVDSVDLWLLQGLFNSGYRPRVLTVEFNSNFPHDMLVTFHKQWHAWTHRSVYGASAGA